MAMRICPKCNYHLEKNARGERWCPVCGRTLSQIMASRKRKPSKSQKERKQEKLRRYERAIRATPQYSYAIRLTEWLYKQYEGEIEGRVAKTIFRNRKYCAHEHVSDDGHQIIYGYEFIDWVFECGFSEYKSLRYLLRGRKMVGLEAVHQTVLHEFAHVLQSERGGRWYGQQHGAPFVKAYQELMDLVPFGEPGMDVLAA